MKKNEQKNHGDQRKIAMDSDETLAYIKQREKEIIMKMAKDGTLYNYKQKGQGKNKK